MLATFVLTEPVLLVVVLAVLVGVVARRVRGGALGGIVAGVLALGVGALLKAVQTPAAGAILLGLCVAVVVFHSAHSYLAGTVRLGRWRKTFCILARTAAWLVVLALIGRPCWDSLIVEWEKPLLPVLLDQSRSMSIVDSEEPGGRSRAAIANAVMREAGPLIAELDRLYEVLLIGVGDEPGAVGGWEITPLASVSPLAAGLRRAAGSRSTSGEPPVGVLLISDGAENVAGARVVREAAAELAALRAPLLALGAGPFGERAPAVMLDALAVPARIGSRDRLRVLVGATIEGCAEHAIAISILWGEELVESRDTRIGKNLQRISAEFDVRPPGVGMQRLTARATLPEALGGESFETSTMIDVSDDRIRVLMAAARPSNETAFALRALRGDPRFDVTQQFVLPERSSTRAVDETPCWADYDVVILGSVPAERLGDRSLRELADAVRARGVGLLMAGGREMFHSGRYVRSELRDVSPVEFRPGPPADDDRSAFTPTDAGRLHPVLREAGAEGGAWDRLPPLGPAASLGPAKKLATVLAADSLGRPLLAAQETGRGRTIAAAWESSWLWVLASDAGAEAHGRLWRQMAAWLANKRPAAWVVTDRADYVRDALRTGRQALRVRAGLSGVGASADVSFSTEFSATLTLRRVGGASVEAPGSPENKWVIPLRRQGAEWRAELPRDLATQSWLAGGEYELEFTVARGDGDPPADGAGAGETLAARAGFTVVASDLELTEPTSNLALLREAALRTRSVGGSYQAVEEAPRILRDLVENDRRKRIERHTRYDPAVRLPWVLLAILVAALACEWTARKGGGLT